jgi:ribonuclease E
VDVSSGKAIKGKEIEETALNVNLEAAAEIARQLRLRDLGGLVVIDFIDMRERKHQSQVLKKLKDELKKDKAKVTVGSFSRFGLIELSRQRIRPPVDFGATQTCPHCQGRGILRTPEAVGRGVLRRMERELGKDCKGSLKVTLSPDTAHYLTNAKRAELARLETQSGVCLEIISEPGMGPEDVEMQKCASVWPLPQTLETEKSAPVVGNGQIGDAEPQPQQKEHKDQAQASAKKPRKRRRSPRRKKPSEQQAGEEHNKHESTDKVEVKTTAAGSNGEQYSSPAEPAAQEAKSKRRTRRRRPRKRRKPESAGSDNGTPAS